MPSPRGAHVARLLATALVLWAAPALARNPPMVSDPAGGVWIGLGESYCYQAQDRWDVFPAGARVNKLAIDGTLLWIATDDGVIKFDTGSRKTTRLGMDDGLPSQVITAVAVDPQYVWFATNKGLARYRKLDRAIRVYGSKEGLPGEAVNDALSVGRQVWFATGGGVTVYDPTIDGLRAFGTKEGLTTADIAELYQVGDDLFLRHDAGLSRFRPRTRRFTNWTLKEIGAQQINSITVDGERVWIGTDNGLKSFESSSDAVIPFVQQAALKGKSVLGVEIFTDYLYITTDKEVVNFYKTTRSIRRYTDADGLLRRDGSSGTVLQGGIYTVVFPDGAWVYNIQRDLWMAKGLDATEKKGTSSGWRFFGKLNVFQPYDLTSRLWGKDRYATAEAGAGLGLRFASGRSLDVSIKLDYGQLEPLVEPLCAAPPCGYGYRDLQFNLDYLGTERDWLRDAKAGDKFEYRYLEEGAERAKLLMGGQVRLATKGKTPRATLTLSGGRRRGATHRDYLSGPRQEIYTLSKHYILPGTERVYLDGELLTSGLDYTIIYTAGQLAFLDPEKVDDLSLVEVEYEYDLEPHKGLGVLSILDLLPADNEVGQWVRAGDARLIREESGLYQQIDGAAPKYIDRGWSRSVYAEYRQGGRSIQVAVHDMGSEANSLSLYTADLPAARETIAGRDNVVIDLGLATAYAAKAHVQSFYIELSIDEKSDAAKQSLKLFLIEILDRRTNAGASDPNQTREWLAAARATVMPTRGLELGARGVELYGILPSCTGPACAARAPRRHLTYGIGDARYERQFGTGGLFTAYGEFSGVRDHIANDAGFSAYGQARISHRYLEGNVSGRYQTADYVSIGSDDTLVGHLRDEYRVAATGYPRQWLPTSVFFMRQASRLEDGGTGLVQHALGRVQLSRDKLPNTSLQAGYSQVAGLTSTMERIKVVGQTEYDLAPLLKFTRIKRWQVRGQYGISQADHDANDGTSYADRVQQLRLETKLAPTATEQAYALFRDRRLARQEGKDGPYLRELAHWELYAGARSAFVRGVIPEYNYTTFYDDDRVTGPLPTRTSRGSMAATLGLYPGQWWSPLAAVALEPRYSLASEARSEGELRTLEHKIHRFDNRAVYAGTGALELEFYQLYERSLTGEDQHLDGSKLELRNRVIYRPRLTSPITFRANYLGLDALNDLTRLSTAPPWAHQSSFEGVVEWLSRWTTKVTTKLKTSYSLGTTSDLLYVDTAAGTTKLQSYRQHRVGVETELRLFPLADAGRLFVLQRNGVFRLTGSGDGSTESVDFYTSAGAIWTIGNALYLDADILYRKLTCLEQPCTAMSPLEMRLFLTWNI